MKKYIFGKSEAANMWNLLYLLDLLKIIDIDYMDTQQVFNQPKIGGVIFK